VSPTQQEYVQHKEEEWQVDAKIGGATAELDLPEKFSVLFVDDDMVLRKLFARSIKRVLPGWRVQEAASGETAIQKVDSESFDLIFMDQYMASTEKQLWGTETTRELRAKGVTCKICDLSANDVEKAFMSAGADAFMSKPIICNKEELGRELQRVLYGAQEGGID
jgi:CheY-like chemotaxis protein